jgi:peptidoglycan hydrolase CwlO-like protein
LHRNAHSEPLSSQEIGAAFVAAAVVQTPNWPAVLGPASLANGEIAHPKRDEKQFAQDLQNLQSRLDQAPAQIQAQKEEIDRLRQTAASNEFLKGDNLILLLLQAG